MGGPCDFLVTDLVSWRCRIFHPSTDLGSGWGHVHTGVLEAPRRAPGDWLRETLPTRLEKQIALAGNYPEAAAKDAGKLWAVGSDHSATSEHQTLGPKWHSGKEEMVLPLDPGCHPAVEDYFVGENLRIISYHIIQHIILCPVISYISYTYCILLYHTAYIIHILYPVTSYIVYHALYHIKLYLFTSYHVIYICCSPLYHHISHLYYVVSLYPTI